MSEIIARGRSHPRFAACLVACLLASASVVPAIAQSTGAGFAVLTDDLDAPDAPASPDAAAAIKTEGHGTGPQKKVEAGNFFEIGVDNGWVVFEGLNNSPTLSFYDVGANMLGSYKLSTPGGGPAQGYIYQGGGIVFAPCPAGAGNRCNPSEDGDTGVGLAFGQVNNSGASAGGWVNDDDLVEHRTNPDFVAGSIAATAVDPTNGAYAVGWDDDATGLARATALTLDAAGQTYTPIAQTDLGTLGGPTSQAFGISKGATYIVGIAQTPTNKYHAVYTTTAAIVPGCGGNTSGTVSTCWIDLEPAISSAATAAAYGAVIKSRAFVANDNGYIVGTATVNESFASRKTQIAVGFVYNVAMGTATMFGITGANVIPMQVLDDGSVVGNLNYVLPKGTTGLPIYHPFLAQGSSVTDFGLMTNATTGQPEYSCRVDMPNHLGELVGACIPTSTTAYGAGTAFYLNAEATTPAYLDLNATVHAINDPTNPAYVNYIYGVASSIDDEHEITLMGFRTENNGSVTRAGFLLEPAAY